MMLCVSKTVVHHDMLNTNQRLHGDCAVRFRDAHTVQELTRSLGFNVTIQENISAQGISSHVDKFGQEALKRDKDGTLPLETTPGSYRQVRSIHEFILQWHAQTTPLYENFITRAFAAMPYQVTVCTTV